MSLKKISKEQPKKFEFTSKNIEVAKKIIQNYPEGKQQSAVMALLYIAQKQNNNWIPLTAMKYIAKFLLLNSKLVGCSLAIFFKLIYQPHQKLYP